MINYEDIIDGQLVSAIDILYQDKLSIQIKDTLVQVYNFEDYDELEEQLMGLIAETNSDESSIADDMLTIVTNFATNNLKYIGIYLEDNDLKYVLDILITLKDLQHLSHQMALELSTIIGDDENGDVYMFSTIVEYFTQTRQHDIYMTIADIKPSIIKDIIKLIYTHADDTYTETEVVDELLNSSYVYNNYIKGIDIKLPYTSLLEILLTYITTTTDIDKIAKEIVVVVMYSNNIENDVYFIQTTVLDDMNDMFIGTNYEPLIEDIINKSIKLLRNNNE